MGTVAFTHPGFLWFCLLGLLPPLIHLLGLRKPRKLRFPPFEFVVRSERQLRAKKRLRSILLLLVRTLLLAIVPLALAGPHAAPPPSGGGYSLDVVIIDNSMSAAQISGGETILEKLKREARRIASGVSPSNRFLLVTASEPAGLLTPFPASSSAAAEAAIGNVAPTYSATSIGGAVSAARAAVENASPTSVRAHLLGDLARHGWREGEDLSIVSGGARAPFEIFDPVPEPGHNISPVAVTAHGTKTGLALSVTVSNHGDARWKTPVKLLAAGAEPAEKEAETPARGEAEVVFEIGKSGRGVVTGTATVGPDALAPDNTLAFATRLGGAVSVLILSGDPRPVKLADESFYFEQALKAGDPDSFHAWVSYPDVLPEDLGRFDVIAMLNCGAVPAVVWGAAESFVRNGGGLLIAAGDRVSPAAQNGVQWLPASASLTAAPPETGLSVKTPGSPAVEPFASDGEPLRAVRISRRLELQPVPGATTVLETAGGRPLLVTGAHGKGRVAIFGSTMDRDWTDWPIRASYLPAVRALVKSLAGDDTGTKVLETAVGEKRAVEIPACPAWIRKGQDATFQRISLTCTTGKGGAVATLISPEVPGLYELQSDAGKIADLVVRTPPAESDLSKIPRKELEAALGMTKKSALGSMIGLAGETQEGFSWASMLLLLALLLLGSEQWLTRRG